MHMIFKSRFCSLLCTVKMQQKSSPSCEEFYCLGIDKWFHLLDQALLRNYVCCKIGPMKQKW